MKAILFDLFETLVTHFDPDWEPPPQTIAQRLGLDQQTYDELWNRFDTAWQLGEINTYGEALASLCHVAKVELDDAVIRQLIREYQEMTALVFERIEPGIVDMVAALRSEGWKLGIITNAGDLDTAPWHSCRLASYFDVLLPSHEVGLLKQDVRIFELACQWLSVQPNQAIFVGDGGGNELRTAVSAGLKTYWCAWFLERWPEEIRPNGFPGDDWRQYRTNDAPPFERLSRPGELLNKVQEFAEYV